MLHCDGEAHHISDYKMTILSRHDKYELVPPLIEKSWARNPYFNAGPVAFPSTLDADIICQIKNTTLKPHQNKWESWNLSTIHLPQMMSTLGGIVTVVNVFNAYSALKKIPL